MELNYETLRTSLRDLIDVVGVTCHEITKESGVYNIRKIANGETDPMPRTWEKLHRIYPEHIPPIELVDHGKRYTQKSKAKNSNVTMSGRDTNIQGDVDNLPTSDQKLIKMFVMFADDEIKAELKRLLVKKIQETI